MAFAFDFISQELAGFWMLSLTVWGEINSASLKLHMSIILFRQAGDFVRAVSERKEFLTKHTTF